ncbi:MAG TPA: hypothetical protein VHS54_07795 [Jatrophihabitans sp.]|nr:hypothetical protein [Jatrophihabitans sp.]
MSWVPLIAWLAALLVAAVVLGFCGYEIIWKAKRLRGDVQALQGMADQIADLRGQLAAAQERMAAAGLR